MIVLLLRCGFETTNLWSYTYGSVQFVLEDLSANRYLQVFCVFLVCPPGRYGLNCSEECGHCRSGRCNPLTGGCPGGCQSNWAGALCQTCELEREREIYIYIYIYVLQPSWKLLKYKGKQSNKVSSFSCFGLSVLLLQTFFLVAVQYKL